MIIITLCLACAVCAILGVLFVVFNKTNLLGLAFKALAPLACLVLALFCANLASAFGGYTIFICFGMGLAAAYHTFENVHYENETNARTSFLHGINFASALSFVAAGIFLVKFNPFALGLGALLGTAVACVVMIFKKSVWHESLFVCLNIIACFAMLGQSIALLLGGILIPAILYLGASVLLAAFALLQQFGKGKVCAYITSSIRILALIALALSIYFL